MSTGMQVLFYKARGTVLDRLIRWWTGGPYSHVELVLAEQEDGRLLCASAHPQDGGIRFQLITPDPQAWDAIPVEGNAATAQAWFENHRGAKYDWFGVFGFVLRPARQDAQRWFCSEAIAAALGFTDPWRFDPATLYAVLRSTPR